MKKERKQEREKKIMEILGRERKEARKERKREREM